MVTQNQKLLKKGERDMVDEVGEEDRISKLCDDLLHHIFSFLPTKCVVRTSILSKRWRYVWNSVPYLDFLEWPRLPPYYCYSQCNPGAKDKDEDNDIHLETKMFMDFMDRMLILRSTGDNYKSTTATTIKKFSLFCNELICDDDNRVNTWISALIRCCNVEELIIHITINHKVEAAKMFPLISLFTCESLTRLDLDGLIFLNLPKSTYLPRLKILGLQLIQFTDECSIEQLVSNCPVLEELRVMCCECGEMNDLSIISAPALKCLFINGYYNKISINAPRLVSLDYCGAVANQYVLRSLVSVVDANIDCLENLHWVRSVLGKAPGQKKVDGATKLLGSLFNVKRLTVSCHTLKALSYRNDFFTNVPTFYNLIHLEVTSYCLYPHCKALLNLLQISPKLESLVFVQSVDPCGSDCPDDEDGWTLNMEPQCLQLKLVEFQKFHGHQRELNMIKLFLKNGRGLQRMTMSSSLVLSKNLDYKLQVTEQLLMFPKASSSCVVKLI